MKETKLPLDMVSVDKASTQLNIYESQNTCRTELVGGMDTARPLIMTEAVKLQDTSLHEK